MTRNSFTCYKKILTRFGIPTSLVFDNVIYFSSLKLYEFKLENGIILKHASNYYAQGNGLAESTNMNIIHIIKKDIFSKDRNWHKYLINSLWEDHVTPNPSMRTFPYFLVYGKEAIFPLNIYHSALQLSKESQGIPFLLVQRRIDMLLKLEEERHKTKE